MSKVFSIRKQKYYLVIGLLEWNSNKFYAFIYYDTGVINYPIWYASNFDYSELYDLAMLTLESYLRSNNISNNLETVYYMDFD